MKLSIYVIACSLIFSLLDFGVIHYTRFDHRESLAWMHHNERIYAAVTYTAEFLFCAPAMAFKPVLGYFLVNTYLSDEQRASITHAPAMSWDGFYMQFDRAKGYQFIPWRLWAGVWLLISVVWYCLIARIL